jgi:hypothetical protein
MGTGSVIITFGLICDDELNLFPSMDPVVLQNEPTDGTCDESYAT